MAKIKSVCASNWNDLGLRVVINSSLKFKINHNYASTPRTGRVSTLLAYKGKTGTFITPKQYTHCFLVAHWSCWTCKSLWRSTLSPCYPVRNSAAGLSPAPQWAPWCCYKVPEPETVLDLDLLFEADWSFGVYWESVPGRPPLSFSLCVWCPLWCKWIARKSLSHSLRGGKTQVLCPDSYFNLRSLTAEALSSNIRRRRRKKISLFIFSLKSRVSTVPGGIPFSRVLCHLCQMRISMGANPRNCAKRSRLFNKTLNYTLHSTLSHSGTSPPLLSL